MLMTAMAMKKEPQEIHLSLHKGLVGEAGHAHIKEGDLTEDNADSTKYLLETLKGHCKLRSNEIVAATVYKQLVQGDLGLPAYIHKMQGSHSSMQF